MRFGASYAVTSQSAASYFGLTSPPLPGAIPPGDDTPAISLTGFLGSRPQTADTNPSENIAQVLDTVTWTKSRHTMKFGGDWRHAGSLFTQVFKDYQLGTYTYNGSTLGGLLGTGSAVPLAGLLLGYPDQTAIGSVVNPATDAQSSSYAVFAQDDWKVSSKLTINYGLRWEYHPGFHDINNNLANWDPSYTSTVNGQTVYGAVILPNQAAFANVNPQFVAAIAPTPVILASQVGLGAALRSSSKKDFAPRIGFAYSLDGKTVLRGGYGRFIEALQSATAINGWSVESSNIGYFLNSLGTNGQPIYQTPYSYPANTAQPGTQFFDLATNLHYKDPIVEEWNLTLERDLGKGYGVRASYDGNHAYNLPTLANINQIHANTTGYSTLCASGCPQGVVPFPQVAFIETGENQGFGNYQAGTISARKRSSSFQMEASYTYTRNLANTIGDAYATAQKYPDEFGNLVSDFYNPGIDYGNVPFSRRNRFLATFLYELPFGKGKTFLNSTNGMVDKVVGGFVLSGVTLFQSGPFMTVSTLSDPSGTGFNVLAASLIGNGGRADTVAGVDPYAGQSIGQWINPAAFTDPGSNIGRFGNSQQGAVQGPSTKAVSISLLKRIPFSESTRLEIGAQVSNIFNHPNYNPPTNLTVGVPGFGALQSLQTAEGAGPREIQLTGRFTF